jgi:hypothetical protein
MYNCAELGRGQDIVHNESTCTQWDLCSNHRGLARWTPPPFPGDAAQCCCTTTSGNGAIRSNCCEVTGNALPDKRKCSPADQQSCTPQFSEAQQCVQASAEAARAEGDPSAEPGLAQYEACRDIYECVSGAYGNDFKRCCSCITFLADLFDADMAIDCSF